MCWSRNPAECTQSNANERAERLAAGDSSLRLVVIPEPGARSARTTSLGGTMRIVMRQLTSMFKLRYVLFGLIALATLRLALSVSRQDGPVRFSSVRPSAVMPGDSSFGFTNNTARQILYRVSRPQLKCNGVWEEFSAPAEFVWMGPSQTLRKIPHQTLASGASSTIDV